MKHWHWEHTEGFITGVIVVSLIWVIPAYGETPVIPEPVIERAVEPAKPATVLLVWNGDTVKYSLSPGQFLYIPKQEPEVVERIVEKVVEVPAEIIVYKNYVWREFESVAQFKEWYHAQDFKTLFPSRIQYVNSTDYYVVDCDDEALRLQRTAFAQGYLISVAITDNGKIYGKQVTKPNHAGNLVLIDDVFYWVEPDPNSFEVIKVVNRD